MAQTTSDQDRAILEIASAPDVERVKVSALPPMGVGAVLVETFGAGGLRLGRRRILRHGAITEAGPWAPLDAA